MKHWIKAFRLRTLPLALSSIGMGGFLAAYHDSFKADIFWLCVLTTLFLQILSNLANDYGDSIHGADGAQRVGPSRAVQSGVITPRAMKSAMFIFGGLAFITGIYLLYQLVNLLSLTMLGFFFLLGLLSIAAAIKYTAGKNPYGYRGLGDVYVFIFFGLVAVLGTYFLQVGELPWRIVLPAAVCGLFSVGVLNVNNLRDIESDRIAGKLSIPVRIGFVAGKWYHTVLVLGGWTLALVFWRWTLSSPLQFISLVTLPLFLRHLVLIWKQKEPAKLDPYLKQLAMSTLFFVLTYGFGLLLGYVVE